MSKKNYERPPISKGDELDIEIVDLAYGGDSVGRYKNFTVFIPYGVPGQTVRAKITELKKNFAAGKLLRVIKESPAYTKPVCQYFGICGGCDWLNMKYTAQIQYKHKFVKFMLEKTAGLSSVDVKQPITFDEPLYYRNRAQYKIVIENNTVKLGFYRARSHEVIGVDKCSILNPVINDIAAVIAKSFNADKKELSLYDEQSGRGYLRHVAIRVNMKGESLVTFVAAGKDVKPFLNRASEAVRLNIKGLIGTILNINMEPGNNVFGDREKVIYGLPFITERAAGIDFNLSSSSFFQVSAIMLEKMAAFVKDNIKPGAKVLDLYGGVGALTLPSRDKFKEIFVVEIDTSAAERLHEMTVKNNYHNVTVVNGRAEDAVDKFMNDARITDLVIDPPRKGIHPKIIAALKRSRIENIIYISCNPASFARDISELKDNFFLSEVVTMDQFPHTYHVELLARLEKKKAGRAVDVNERKNNRF